METVAEELPKARATGQPDTARKQIRGSSLLLLGSVLSAAINFAAQVFMVRYLSTKEFGGLAYALSVVAFCQVFSTFGLQKAIPRFVPIYHEKREYGKLFGTVLLVLGTILLALAIVTALDSMPRSMFRFMTSEHLPLALLSIMVFLIPIQAMDDLLVSLLASLGSPRTIFLRSYVLAPGLKLAAVLLLIALRKNVTFLAYGYLAASALGVAIFAVVLIRQLHRQGLFQGVTLGSISVPFKEMLAFAIPILSSDLVTNVVMNAVAVFMLDYYHNISEVAFYRVAVPAARINLMVMASFSLLYTPLAARLFAQNDYDGINSLYWRTTVWMTVLTFPIFAMTFCMARPLVLFLYGARYEHSAATLALLSLGCYFNVALGLNGLTLRVFGKLRYILTVNAISLATNVALNLVLIPRYGALGAAIGTAGTMIVLNVFTQVGLRFVPGVSFFDRRYWVFYVMIALSAAGLFVLQFFTANSIYIAAPLAGLASLGVLAVAKKNLKIAEAFPELMRLPLAKLIFA